MFAVCGGASSAFLHTAQSGLHVLHLLLQHLLLLGQLLVTVREDKQMEVSKPQRATLNPCRVFASALLHSGLSAQLLVLLCQLLVAFLHALHHLLQLPHLLLELLVAHLKVSNTIHQL